MSKVCQLGVLSPSRGHSVAALRHVRLPCGLNLPHRRGEGPGSGYGCVRRGEEGCTGEEVVVVHSKPPTRVGLKRSV